MICLSLSLYSICLHYFWIRRFIKNWKIFRNCQWFCDLWMYACGNLTFVSFAAFAAIDCIDQTYEQWRWIGIFRPMHLCEFHVQAAKYYCCDCRHRCHRRYFYIQYTFGDIDIGIEYILCPLSPFDFGFNLFIKNSQTSTRCTAYGYYQSILK